MAVDPTGWKQVAIVLAETAAKLQVVHDQSRKRIAETAPR